LGFGVPGSTHLGAVMPSLLKDCAAIAAQKCCASSKNRQEDQCALLYVKTRHLQCLVLGAVDEDFRSCGRRDEAH
jgi:hypothetical protein